MRFHEIGESDEHRALRAAVGAITDGFGATYFAEHSRDRQPTTELWQALGRHGYIGVNLPEEYGGGGGGLVELAIVCEEVAAHGCPLLLLLVSGAIAGEVLTRFGTAGQKGAWLPRLAAGTGKIVFAITEPDAGSNTHRLATTATRDGERWLLRGTKHYISGVNEADAILVVARTGTDPGSGRGRLALFLVDTDDPRLTATPLPVEGAAPEQQFTLFFDDVAVSADRLIGTEGDGLRQVFHGLNPERVTGAALGVGIARQALARATEYARTREVWDRPIGTHQAIAHPLAQAAIEVELAALMTYRAAWLHDAGEPAGEAANMAKYAAAEAAIHAVDAAIQTHGGNGMSRDFGLVPLWGMARTLRIAPVSREMILNHVAQHTLGLPRSY
ncbi:acyl-CoA dehydrogenase family protein [Embleya sp. NBC_00896]|uniref:acyl-CoA dehydrogenase family protein n=1 Tax=Embleya sp. NBC_00896 TaxID=2975961 RepID=UPI003869F33E|nr:acyl-CoA dehydrogenase family protein [Embleya sp. NBC_00896]